MQMMSFSRKVSGFAALAGLLALSTTAIAQDTGDFDPFKVDDLSAPKTVKKIDDPTGSAPTRKIYAFGIPAAYCNPKRYDPSQPDSDCTWKSSRSQIREDVFATKKNGKAQPKESWYGWSVYFPDDFAYGPKQTKGHYEFVYWHNHQCPHLSLANDAGSGTTLYLQTNKALGNYDCEPGVKLPIADFSQLVGKWSRFEVFVHWANDDTGKAEVHINGKLAVEHKGPNLTKGLEKINYFKFGVYLCCTDDVKQIKAANVYYSNVKRAPTREGLAVKQ